MKKQRNQMMVAVLAGTVALLIYMPVRNPCLLNFDRSAKPLELAQPNEAIAGMVACDDFRPAALHWFIASLFPLLLGGVGVLAGRATKNRAVAGGLAAGCATLLAFLVGGLVYPWLEAYWMRPADLWQAGVLALVFGAAGGWLTGGPNNVFKGRRAKRARP